MSTPTLHLYDTGGEVTPFMLLSLARMTRGVGAIELHVDRAGGSVDVYRYEQGREPESLGTYTPSSCCP